MHVATVLHDEFKKQKFAAQISCITSPLKPCESGEEQREPPVYVLPEITGGGGANTQCGLYRSVVNITVQTYKNKTVGGFHHSGKKCLLFPTATLQHGRERQEMSPQSRGKWLEIPILTALSLFKICAQTNGILL